MKFYLSSFRLGDKASELFRLMPENKKIAYIPNASDYTKIDWNKKNEWEGKDIKSLEALGLTVQYLDLKNYFGEIDSLRKALDELGGVFVRGGNTFILRQAMYLSGFDVIFKELLKEKAFLYAGYSAGICVLGPTLKALQIVDDPSDKPYAEMQDTIWEGLDYLDHIILPHYKSEHPESADIDKEVEYCKKNKIPFKTLRDGDVIIIEEETKNYASADKKELILGTHFESQMTRDQSEISRIFSALHDGSIIKYANQGNHSILTIECLYLAKRINKKFSHFNLKIFNLKNIQFTAWMRNHDHTPIIITDPEQIFQTELDILRSKIADGKIEISLIQESNTSLSYVGGDLSFNCTGLSIFTEEGVELKYSDLHKIASQNQL